MEFETNLPVDQAVRHLQIAVHESAPTRLVRIPAKAITWSGDGDRSSERSDALLCSPQPPRFTVAASYCGF